MYARGVERRVIFVDREDHDVYLRLLFGVAHKFRWRCLAYCLMPNHVHLLIETTKPNLGRGMQLLHGRYAQTFNDKYGRVGHLFQSRFGSRVLHDDAQIAAVFSYIAANPVKAALCSRAEDWEWSSYGPTVEFVRHELIDLGRLRAYVRGVGLTCSELVEERLLSDGLRVPA